MFYGWYIVGASFIWLGLSAGISGYSAGVFVKPIVAELGGGRLGANLAYGGMAAIPLLLSPLIGRALDRFPARLVLFVGTSLYTSGLFLLATSEALVEVVISVLALGSGVSTLGSLVATTLIARWFVERRGLALGLMATGASVGGAVIAPAGALLIESFGWRSAVAILAAVALVTILPLALTFATSWPSDRGLRAYGASGEPPPSQGHDALPSVLRDRSFWIIALSLSLVVLPFGGVFLNLVPLATDQGIGLTRASLLMTILTTFGVAGKLGIGSLLDRFDPRLMFILANGCAAAGSLLLLSEPSYARMAAASAAFGLATGGLTPIRGVLVGTVFGAIVFGRVIGLMYPFMLPANVLSAPIAGWIRDASGSYDGALWVYAVSSLLGMILIAFLPLERRG